MKVTFVAGDSQATVTDVERIETTTDQLECYGGDSGEKQLMQIPLDALESVTTTDKSGGAGDKSSAYDSAAMVTADPSEADESATHTVALQVDHDVDDFAYFRVDYAIGDAHTNVNDVDEDNIVRFGVDTNDDGVIEKSIATGDWSVSHGGSGYTLRVRNEEWDGSLEPGDDLILEFDGVTNPSTPGTYEVELVLNGHQTAKTAYTVGGGDIHSPDVVDDTDTTVVTDDTD